VVRFGAVDEPNFCYLLGAIMADKQLLRPALAQFERVRELSPDRLDARLSLARLFVAGRDYTNAMSAADEILALSPTNQTGLVLKAGVCLHLQDYAPAVSLLTQALALNPTNNLALLNRGEAYGGLRQWDAARRDFNAVLQTLTNAYPAYLDLAKLAEQEHNSAAAVTNYQLFLKYAPPATREFAAVQAHLRALQPAAP
jgi:tetratricopeptide (TPR) repeat protein